MIGPELVQQIQEGFAGFNGNLFETLFEKNDIDLNPNLNVLKNCNYSEIDTFINQNEDFKNKFSVYSNNIRSLPNKWNEFSEHINDFTSRDFKFSVLCIQELWNIPPVLNPVLSGYRPLIYKTRDPTGRNSNAGGGVGIFVDDKYNCEMIDSLSIFVPHVFESITVKINVSKSKFIILCNIYRPNSGPLAGVKIFNDYLEKLLFQINNDPLFKNHSDLILTGDFNIDLLKMNSHQESARYFDILLENEIYPTISKPTRISQNSATIIDHINVKNSNESAKSGVLLDSLSDHCPVYYLSCYEYQNISNKPVNRRTRLINEETNLKFQSILTSQNWNSVIDENRPALAFACFFNIIKTCYDEAFPVVQYTSTVKNTPINPWMTHGLLQSRKTKQKLYSRKTLNPTANNIEKFNNFVKVYKKLCRKAKQEFYVTRIRNFKENAQKTWQTIREVLGSFKDKSEIPEFFIENGDIIKGDLNIAEGFNKFFSSIGSKLSSEIPVRNGSFKAYLKNEVEENFVFKQITSESLLEISKTLKPKKSSGVDNLSSNQLKFILPQIADPLSHIFNLSLQTGYIPIELKTARVVPIFKAESMHSFNSYRPISLLPSLSKLLEKLVASQMIKFLNKHNILYSLQFGFRKGHNTTQPVVHFLDKIYNALNKAEPEFTIGIFLDLKKAFDTADHTILVDKLRHYGFRGVSNLWFKNYLQGRQQIVSIKGVESSSMEINVGVPQGSVLGPLLFLILINDLPNAVDFLTLLFADDTTFQLSGKSLPELFAIANLELEKASVWFELNKLTLNASKTKYIVFRPKKKKETLDDFYIKIDNNFLERIGDDLKTKSFKFVGVHIDENLSWTYHIQKVKAKLSFINQQISKVKNILPTDTLLTLYNCLFKPQIEYCIIAWGGVPNRFLKGIINAQKKCVRNILCKKYLSHTEPLFKKLSILKFEDLFNYNCLLFMHKYVHCNLSTEIFKMANSVRTKNIVTEKCKLKSLEFLPSYYLPHRWNTCTNDLKNETNSKSFKNLIHSTMEAKYSKSTKNCGNSFCPDCL